MPEIPDILSKIISSKRREVEIGKSIMSKSELMGRVAGHPPPRGFEDKIRRIVAQDCSAVIAECKKASPSKGVIRADYDVRQLCRSYQQGGAACLSVLTDEQYFSGSLQDLSIARQNCSLPVLRKDFIVDSYQVVEARAYGADCILLIASVLEVSEMSRFGELAQSLGMDVLIEVHSRSELESALELPFGLIGINNRNLHTFETSLSASIELCSDIPSERITVAESGIHTREDVARLRDAGINAFLVGESFMKSDDPGAKLNELFSDAKNSLTEVA